MPCPTCGAPNQTDLSAESHGLMLKSEAAKISGRSRTWVQARIDCGELETRTFAGRTLLPNRSRGCSASKAAQTVRMRRSIA